MGSQRVKSLYLISVTLFLAILSLGAANSPTPTELLDRVDDLYRGKSSQGKMRMNIKSKHWERSLTLEFWSEGTNKSLMRIESPKKEKGTTTLMVNKDVWNFLPKVKRVIKVPRTMMGASWMGSHFTNDDLVRQSRMADDYDANITFRGKRNGASIFEITCMAKKDAAVVWGKVVVEMGQTDRIPRSVRYFDEELKLTRTMLFSDIRKIGTKELPLKIRVTEVDRPGEHTEMIYDELKLDVSLPPDLFSLRRLQR